MVAITVVLAGVLYVWVTQIVNQGQTHVPETIIATLDQGEGNISSGVLFILEKGGGESKEIADYNIRVGKEGASLITLKWPQNGNSTFSLDSDAKSNDDKFWDTTERMGFDAPPGLTGVSDGDKIEVKILNIVTSEVVYSHYFIYRD